MTYQETILNAIAATEAQLANAVAARDAAEILLGIRRGAEYTQAQGAARNAAQRQLAQAQGEIAACVANLEKYANRLERGPAPFDPSVWGVHRL